MLNQYYGDFKNIYTFIDWYKDQCKYMNKTTDANYNCDWWFNNSGGSDFHIKQAYLTCMTQNNQFDKLEDDIYQKVQIVMESILSMHLLQVVQVMEEFILFIMINLGMLLKIKHLEKVIF